jgi:hypothetical protein
LSGEKAFIFKTRRKQENYGLLAVNSAVRADGSHFKVIFNGVVSPEFTAAVVLAPVKPGAVTDTV